MNTTSTATTYSAWWRQGKREKWERIVAEAPDYDAAFNRLLDALQGQPKNGESLVVRGDVDPNAAR
jgi:hypothetical protein